MSLVHFREPPVLQQNLSRQEAALGSCTCTLLNMVGVYAQELEYIVRNSANRKQKISLLSKVSGSLYPGQLTALV